MKFGNLPKFFAKIWLLSLRDQKRSKNYYSLQKSLKTFRCTRRLQFWEIWQNIHAKSSIISLNDQKPWAKFLHSKETSQKCSSEHFEWNFDNHASIFCLIVQTFLLEVRRSFKKQFFNKFFPPTFFCISILFLWHPDYFLSVDKKSCSNSKTDEQTNFFLKKYFFSENASGRADCSCDNLGKKFSFRLSVFWIRVRKKCERLYIFQNMFFPKNFRGNIDCGFRNSSESFRWK